MFLRVILLLFVVVVIIEHFFFARPQSVFAGLWLGPLQNYSGLLRNRPGDVQVGPRPLRRVCAASSNAIS